MRKREFETFKRQYQLSDAFFRSKCKITLWVLFQPHLWPIEEVKQTEHDTNSSSLKYIWCIFVIPLSVTDVTLDTFFLPVKFIKHNGSILMHRTTFCQRCVYFPRTVSYLTANLWNPRSLHASANWKRTEAITHHLLDKKICGVYSCCR